MNLSHQTILALGPHPDDVELGCGGTLHRLVNEGAEVHYVAFSLCEKSLPEGMHPNTLEFEAKKSTRVLGIPEGNVRVLQFEVREFPAARQEILDKLIEIRSQVKPSMVLLPSTSDVHQDHQVITQEGIRAFKNSSLLGYELPWNTLTFASNFHVRLSEENLKAKVAALAEFRSQAHRNYMQNDFIGSLAKVRGAQINAPLAEAFETIRWIV